MALEVWTNLEYDSPNEQPYEWSLGALDLFVLTASREGDIEDVRYGFRLSGSLADQEQIFTRLDFYVTCIRQDHPGIDELSPRNKATLVARYLKARGWTSIQIGRDYHNVEHNFLGVALYGEGHNSLPLITVIIYCYVARGLGLRAAPCSFPMHVHALVRPPRGYDLDGAPLDADGEDPAMYMDPFRSDEEVPLNNLKGQLRLVSHQFTDAEVEGFLLESNARDITLRCARNIFNSQRSMEAPLEDVDKDDAMYGAAWASVLVRKRIDMQPFEDVALLMQAFLENSTYDVGLIEKYILPLCVGIPDYNRYSNECRDVRLSDEMKRRRDRSGKNAVIKYKVGQVFHHKRYGYIAAITGWDPECSSSELWIHHMGVDRLPKGRQQPFYHVL
jgi:F-box protein 21